MKKFCLTLALLALVISPGTSIAALKKTLTCKFLSAGDGIPSVLEFKVNREKQMEMTLGLVDFPDQQVKAIISRIEDTGAIFRAYYREGSNSVEFHHPGSDELTISSQESSWIEFSENSVSARVFYQASGGMGSKVKNDETPLAKLDEECDFTVRDIRVLSRSVGLE